jgi:hypothetical protein
VTWRRPLLVARTSSPSLRLAIRFSSANCTCSESIIDLMATMFESTAN